MLAADPCRAISVGGAAKGKTHHHGGHQPSGLLPARSVVELQPEMPPAFLTASPLPLRRARGLVLG